MKSPTPLACVARLRRDETGSIAVIAAFMLVAIIGLIALGVDVSLWYRSKQMMQTAADAAATAGAYQLQAIGKEDPSIAAAAIADATANGVSPGDGTVINVNVVDANHVETVITSKLPLRFASLVMATAPTVAARAVAAVPAGAPPCLTVLDTGKSGALKLGKPDTRINAPTCRLNVNSKSSTGIDNKGFIDAAEICAVGGAGDGSDSSNEIKAGCKVFPDPLADWYPPETPSACDNSRQRKFEGGEHVVPNAGEAFYCDKIDIKNGAHVTFSPGIYFIKKGGLKVSGGSRIDGDGVIFILLDDSKLEISQGSTVDLSAPTSGPAAGVVLTHGKPRGCKEDKKGKEEDEDDEGLIEGVLSAVLGSCGTVKAVEHKITGGSSVQYEGAIYLPGHKIRYEDNSSSSNVPPFTTYIVKSVTLDSGSTLALDNNYAASNVPVVGAQHKVRLVE